jgi:hypothetical protein
MAFMRRVAQLAMTWVFVAGCAAETVDPEHADYEAVLEGVEALGFERNAANVLVDRVVVDGDIIFDREGLLRGEYERWDQPEDEPLVEKGYRYPGLIAEKHRGNIRLLFAPGKYAPTPEIRSAFLAAAVAWSEVPGSSIRISPDNNGPAIVVRTVPVENWERYSGCKNTDACAYAPRDGRPGYDIFIRARSIDTGCNAWSPSGLAYTARHEIGHTLGFAHPKEKGGKHVSGTQACTRMTEQECTYEPTYSTVMAAATITSRCVYSPARVTQDDYATCAAVYPAR